MGDFMIKHTGTISRRLFITKIAGTGAAIGISAGCSQSQTPASSSLESFAMRRPNEYVVRFPSGELRLKGLVSASDALENMKRIDQLLPDTDGLKWFNFLYMTVTQAVKEQLATGTVHFADPAWIDALDVTFADLYFSALVRATQGGVEACPRCWRPLLSGRQDKKIARIQFALAGMNAHINRDLVVGLLALYQADGSAPDDVSARHQDFLRVDQLLTQVEKKVRDTLLVGTPLEHEHSFAPLEDIIAMWSVTEIRRSAWNQSQAIWQIRSNPWAVQKMLDSIDAVTEAGSRGYLVRVLNSRSGFKTAST
jgi:hypothetical protein